MYAPPCSWRTGTKSIDESASDSFRSSVSSPGMPKTWRTPSASRHSTNTSEALRGAMSRTIPGLPWFEPMRPIALSTAVAIALAGAAPAPAYVIRGHGYGHGIGMSQWGAHGFAKHGRTYDWILRHYYRGTELRRLPGRDVRVLLEAGQASISFAGATQAGGRGLDERRTYTARLTPRGILVESRGRRVDSFVAPLRVSSANGTLRLGGTALNGVTDGAYRGALEIRPSVAGGLAVVNVVPLDG